jgi:hypothetical protein
MGAILTVNAYSTESNHTIGRQILAVYRVVVPDDRFGDIALSQEADRK